MGLIDADRLRKAVLDLHDCYNGFSDTYDKACIIDLVDEQPTVKAIEVVRCKDCQFFHRYGFKLEYTECAHFDCDVTEDGYCCWAERREDG